MDFPVYTQEFQNIPLNEPTYDAVTAWAVLEHVHDPMAYFRKAAQVVKKDGLFVFLVPNFASVASRSLFCEDLPRHLYFFTRKPCNSISRRRVCIWIRKTMAAASTNWRRTIGSRT